jgi:hypothetical protein
MDPNSIRTTRKLLKLMKDVAEQTEWMERCGQGSPTLAGYLKTYGSASDPEHSGDGAEAIYAADKAEFDRLNGLLNDFIDKHQGIRV